MEAQNEGAAPKLQIRNERETERERERERHRERERERESNTLQARTRVSPVGYKYSLENGLRLTPKIRICFFMVILD